ncbi:Methylmalonate-semialdehyde dehydrogenase [acylating] mitochondrial [Ceratocystis platani]|uniref:Methylmalonate-semialdehyde dehydrogenase [acylating] mitochondrial n=1 Tax=Ceratocystis fimbriata f. sp. platani TaxID=88771 RepID=A0A0F8DBN1_CERFI|nr:Methylmalonate-semialdehyde dehydrogenase [acylating] mitochondrial [Ceratocystis platani]
MTSDIPANVKVLPQNKYLLSLMTILRDGTTESARFAMTFERVCSQLMASALDFVPAEKVTVTSPIGAEYEGLKHTRKVCGVSILRAGASMESSLRDAYSGPLSFGKILIQRNEETALPTHLYSKLPQDLASRTILMLEPMLATGGSASQAIDILKQNGALEENIIFVNCIASLEGIAAVTSRFPKLTIVTASVDLSMTTSNRYESMSSSSQSGLQATGLESENALAKGVTYNFVYNEFLISKSRCWSKVYDPLEDSVRAVSFVGSDIAGERIYDHAKATRKRIQAECSGKNHGVVLDDANKMKTLYAIAGSAFGAAGQRCMALSVAVLVGSTAEWINDLVGISQRLVLGCGLDPTVEVGPLINRAAKQRVEEIITNAEAEGATVLLDGRNYHVPDYPNGNFLGPTILTNVKPYMSCYQEEIFGPVLACITVDTLEEAIQLINENRSC